MKATPNTIANKRSFKIVLFQGCPIYGKLKFDRNKKGYLKYFNEKGEITEDGVFESVNKLITDSIINQAETICKMKYATLWSY